MFRIAFRVANQDEDEADLVCVFSQCLFEASSSYYFVVKSWFLSLTAVNEKSLGIGEENSPSAGIR